MPYGSAHRPRRRVDFGGRVRLGDARVRLLLRIILFLLTPLARRSWPGSASDGALPPSPARPAAVLCSARRQRPASRSSIAVTPGAAGRVSLPISPLHRTRPHPHEGAPVVEWYPAGRIVMCGGADRGAVARSLMLGCSAADIESPAAIVNARRCCSILSTPSCRRRRASPRRSADADLTRFDDIGADHAACILRHLLDAGGLLVQSLARRPHHPRLRASARPWPDVARHHAAALGAAGACWLRPRRPAGWLRRTCSDGDRRCRFLRLRPARPRHRTLCDAALAWRPFALLGALRLLSSYRERRFSSPSSVSLNAAGRCASPRTRHRRNHHPTHRHRPSPPPGG